ncbi:MAG TPA: hypothetical protein VI279_06770, partial [Rhodocyclaceae bacterium]
MFDWLSNKLRTASKGDGHPLGSAAALREFVDALPKSSPIPCLRAVDEWLQDAHGLAGTLSPDAYRQALSVLDASAQEALQRLWLDLFPQAGGMADDRWALLHTHYGYVQEAYQLALPMFSAGGELSAAERKELALCLLRTLRAMALRHKLNRLRYKAPQESFWQDMLGLYQKARSRNLVTLGMRPYNEDGANTSIQGELLRV